ncbi:MAG: DUF1820 family protein [Acidobacteria bacterium]|nr:MAG: DUF1820 family protein [Acidobacteriota bacterium]
MPQSPVYRILFHNQGRVYEIYAKSVSQGALFGFVEIEQLLFGERSQVVVDPTEETLKNEFRGVRRSYLPMHSIIRIDEVDKQGTSRITAASREGTLMPFPAPIYTKPKK